MNLEPREAIILAGGMGTRLASVVQDVPKPMAPVAGRPFLEHLFPQLKAIGIERVILSVGHKWEVILAHFGYHFKGIDIEYAVETVALGTGGGLKLAFEKCTTEHVIVLNGDTIFRHDLHKFWLQHRSGGGLVSLALKEMRNFDRYGTVERDEQFRITSFLEKKAMSIGLINAGVYVINQELWAQIDVPEKFSFEKDVLEKYVNVLTFKAFRHEGYFIDIGVPEDYAQANLDLKGL